jgi:hypothetical protein
MVRQLFRNMVICLGGPMGDPYTIANMTRWCEMRKGVFVTEFSDAVTHVLCTPEQFKAKTKPSENPMISHPSILLPCRYLPSANCRLPN